MSESRPTGLRRWGGYLALTVIFALVCGLLSWWQWSRRAEAVDEIDKVEANYDMTPVPVDELLPALDAWDDADEWRPVVLHGTYLLDEQLLARNRPRDGAPGFEVLTPLLLDDGTVFVVDRGWLRVGSAQDDPDHVPAPPAGEVDGGRAAQAAASPTLPGRTAPPGQLATIHLDDVAELTGEPTYTGAYGLLASENPARRRAAAPGHQARGRRGSAPLLRPAVDRVRHPRVHRPGLGLPSRAALRLPARGGSRRRRGRPHGESTTAQTTPTRKTRSSTASPGRAGRYANIKPG